MENCIDWLAKRAQLSPNNIALVDRVKSSPPAEISYQAWNAMANQTANFIKGTCDCQKGDRIAILATNCVEYLNVVFACNKLGIVLQNLNWRLAVPELEQLIKDVKPLMMFYSSEFAETVHTIKQRADVEIEKWVAFDKKAQESDIPYSETYKHPESSPPSPDLQGHDPWLLCYTGGTTGLPKACIHTYTNVAANAVNTLVSWELSSKDCAILNAPLFHTGGLHVFTTPLVYAGGTSIVCQAFDVDQTFDLVDEKRVTVFFGIPTMFVMMQNHPRWEKTRFDHMKFVIAGGAPCPETISQAFWKKNVDFKTGYGMTEAGPNTFWLHKEKVQSKPGSVGYPLMHVEIKLVDDQGNKITQPDVHGELWIRGPHRTPGYLNNPQATADTIDKQGWLHTGDLASFDSDGCYYVVGRKKDMYISGGENVYPIEVESLLFTHPAIAEAAVFGVPHHVWGEVGRAVVSLKANAEPQTEQAMIAWMRERIAHYKVPLKIYFTDVLPKTAAGKISKTQLREQYGELEPQDDRRSGKRQAWSDEERRGRHASDET